MCEDCGQSPPPISGDQRDLFRLRCGCSRLKEEGGLASRGQAIRPNQDPTQWREREACPKDVVLGKAIVASFDVARFSAGIGA